MGIKQHRPPARTGRNETNKNGLDAIGNKKADAAGSPASGQRHAHLALQQRGRRAMSGADGAGGIEAAAGDDGTVNPHYLAHMVETGAKRGVEASEDIVAANGMKLLAKGARVDPQVRERLLQHKLLKPLEQCVSVVDGVVAERLRPLGEELLDQHPLLAALCDIERAQPVLDSLTRLPLSGPVRSLLSVYADHQGDRLRHTVGVAMLASALARRLVPGDVDRQRLLATAGLVHDIGELYIDPQVLRSDGPLGPVQWRHIATHPLVGERVLRRMEGAGAQVAQAVLLHHERLDGFGYPRGVGGAQLSLDGQILGAAEWLMALIESGMTPLARASIATRLIPGEFSDELLEIIGTAARQGDELRADMAVPAALDDAVPRVQRIAATLERFAAARPWIAERIAEAAGEHRQALETCLQRMLRIQIAFSRTGLDAGDPQFLLRELGALDDRHVHLEVMTIVHELGWRMREIERETLLRGALLPEAQQRVLQELIARFKGGGEGTQAAAAQPSATVADGRGPG